jgi:hypothetical protein
MRFCLWLMLLSAIGCASRTEVDRTRSTNGECDESQALDLFERKIEPLFSDDHPSSCSQCHLPGVDLQAFARDSACETYACLVQQGLVDEDDPDGSLVLGFIGRAEPDSELITERVLQREHAAFSQWITYVSECGVCEDVSCGDAAKQCQIDPEPKNDVEPTAVDPGGCEPPNLEALFRDAVYVYRGRCAPCHINDHDDPATPMWIEAAFDCSESLTRTFNNVQQNGYLDLDTPEQSLLLLKPLAEFAGVEHGGGQKFQDKTDPAYVSFKYFIERLAACQK